MMPRITNASNISGRISNAGYLSNSSPMKSSPGMLTMMRYGKTSLALLMSLFLFACASYTPKSEVGGSAGVPAAPSGDMRAVAWTQVDGWQDDSLIGADAALLQNCSKLAQQPNWRAPCAAAAQLDALDPEAIRAFFQRYFTPFELFNRDGSHTGLITGYYEPLLHGSRVRHGIYQTPLYHWPAGRPRGSLPARADLMRSGILRGNELVYVDDPIEAFFLQVQGSGQIELDDGTIMRVGYDGTNDKPYRSIGRWLIDHGDLSPAQATMQGIRAWARANPQRVAALLNVNPRFVFFREMPNDGVGGLEGPIGALGVPLTAQRSIAVDPRAVPLGSPVFLSTTRPAPGGVSGGPLTRLMFAQDTGSAIKGGVRADFFWGLGDQAGD
ncbi:MAG: MltA domain-containing protein, partial [Burkholderiales bacterium]|nr:MltA domain-containing protein [Burkholderiales bacterium]